MKMTQKAADTDPAGFAPGELPRHRALIPKAIGPKHDPKDWRLLDESRQTVPEVTVTVT